MGLRLESPGQSSTPLSRVRTFPHGLGKAGGAPQGLGLSSSSRAAKGERPAARDYGAGRRLAASFGLSRAGYPAFGGRPPLMKRQELNDHRVRSFPSAEMIAFVCECADEGCR